VHQAVRLGLPSLAEPGREIVLDGEIAAPDERHRSGAIRDGVLQAVSLY
jgi:hypothetical protein